jgi:hypothetical protein
MESGGESARRPRAGTTGPRNVRTPQGRVLGNTQSGRPAGKCHREQTADGGTGLRSGPAQGRVKRCGKSAPAPGATRVARQTPPGARPRRGRTARPQTPPGRPLEPAGNRRPRGMAATDGSAEPSGQNPAYRPTRHRTPSDPGASDRYALELAFATVTELDTRARAERATCDRIASRAS